MNPHSENDNFTNQQIGNHPGHPPQHGQGFQNRGNVRPRELKVEDALLYLDQVKMEFSDKPHIYNEFLDIMKNFKAQSINTPGVIERVKTLFKGYNKLILGFNTFLPEGEGYKIELTPEEQNYQPDPSPVSSVPQAPVSVPVPGDALNGGKPGQGPTISQPASNTTIPSNPTVPVAPQNLATGALLPPLAAAIGPGMMMPAINAPPAPGPMQQAHAIHYVTKIRNRFTNEPETYRSFLKILHTYQKEQKGIKEVLEQVSLLFAGHADLLLEFTYFLPDAVQDQAKERLERAANEARKNPKIPGEQKPRKNSGNPNMAQVPGAMMMQPHQMRADYNPAVMGMMPGVDLNSLRETNISGTKRSRVDREGKQSLQPGMMNPGMMGPGGYNPQITMHGMDDGQLMVGMPPGKKQNMPLSGTLQPGQLPVPNQQPRKPRRKNANQNEGVLPLPQMDVKMQQHLMMGGGAQKSQKDSHQSVSAERRFFDVVKESMMAVSRDNWSEFVKFLELFTNDAITKEEMLEAVQDLFGANNHQLFDEFRRLIDSRADYQERKEDMWFSVPLSEIDFTQCRKCTPSYRALPRNYPRPKCSERNDEEERVLNDVWVSIPIGSEESYSFKHMRKNQYEEALFKCEDERFEIDMIIDSNMSTIRVLEPLAEEINSLKAASARRDGSAGPRFSLQLEKRQLSTIHLNAISRIYGDHGEEILELLRKNPAGTVPVVLKRLKQKDQEWRRARQELNKHWKEVVEKNHYKSFDHRSFYFRQTDKKFLSTKPLVQEIVTAAANQAGGSSSSVKGVPAEDQGLGLNFAISPEFTELLAGMTPHLVLDYDHDAHLLHRDVYRLVCHAAETTLQNVSDRERVAALWRDLIRAFFNLPPHYLYSPSNLDGMNNNLGVTVAAEAWPRNSRVLTTYGSGKIISYREEDGMYEVELGFGKAFLGASAIFGMEQLPDAALYAIGVGKDGKTGKDTIFQGQVQPDSTSAGRVTGPSRLFYGTQMCYIFLRLHQTVYARLRIARMLALDLQQQQLATGSSTGPANTSAVPTNDAPSSFASTVSNASVNSASTPVGSSNRSLYGHFLGGLQGLVEGSMDNARFEDFVRNLLGNRAYPLYTLDKLISQLVKHLVAMANDDNVNKLVGLFVYHSFHRDAVDPTFYRSHVAQILSHTMEEVFRIQLLCPKEGIMAGRSEVAIQHLGIISQLAATQASSSSSGSVKSVAAPNHATRGSSITNGRNNGQTSNSGHGLSTLDVSSNNDGNNGDDDIEMEIDDVAGPNAVVSDNEEDEEEESTKASLDGDVGRKVVFSPRVRP